MREEPILREEDIHRWTLWEKTCLEHSKTTFFQKRLDAAKKIVEGFYKKHPKALLSWSLGKDSTAMIHLVRVECEIDSDVFCMMNDDIDFPGSLEYMREIETKLNFECFQLRTNVSVVDWISKNGVSDPCSDFHSKSSKIMYEAFFLPIEEYMKSLSVPGIYLGLRSEESKGRRLNRRARGASYLKKNGEAVCTPIVDWKGKDVYAYLFSRGIEPFHVYRCCGFYGDPSMIRLDGWLPGEFAAQGEVSWLRHYYPSLYRRLLSIMKGASQYV